MIYVENIQEPSFKENFVYCYVGRSYKFHPKIKDFSVLGNPYKVGEEGTRDEVIVSYDGYLQVMIEAKYMPISDALNDIYKLACANHVVLLCHCYPKACHADVIQKRILEVLPKSGNLEEQIERELVIQGYKRNGNQIEWIKPMYKPVGKRSYVVNPAIKLLRNPYLIEDTSIDNLKKLLRL